MAGLSPILRVLAVTAQAKELFSSSGKPTAGAFPDAGLTAK